jgi:hypothetical protein
LLDVDGDGSINFTTDGLMVVRMMLGLTGAAVTENAIANNATRPTWTEISSNLTAYCGSVAQCLPDVDGNGSVQGGTDGLMLVRALAGFTGTAVTNGALGASPSRPTWAQIRPYLNANCGTNFAP